MQSKSQDNIIGKNIKQLRNHLGITQEVLSSYLGITREQIAFYENGSRSITTKHLTQLANLFCLNEYDFYESNIENQKVNMAFAFRADKLLPEDLKSISQFKKIVLNYINMKNALVDE
jgi:transcriptional regulator with XRE-family HTH domain